MRSVRVAAGVVLSGAALILSASAAQAAPESPSKNSADCKKALAAVDDAEADLKNLNDSVAAGGHPDQAQLDAAENAVNVATSEASRICGVTPGPHHTGLGGSQGSDTAQLAGGLALLVAAGAGGAVMVRRSKAAARI